MEIISEGNLMTLSQQLLLAVKTRASTDSLVRLLAIASREQSIDELNSDDNRKAFWINCYNAFTQIMLLKNTSVYKHRSKFFSKRCIVVTGEKLSLDDIEHGILRGSKIKWAMGYLGKLFPSEFEKEMRVNKTDYRIHFTLNCGAMSCPAIAFYNSSRLEQQLELATGLYLKQEVRYVEKENTVFLPAIMGWFRHDFGGRRNMIAILKRYEIIAGDINSSIRFKKYNWKLFLENYKKI